jgi:hypothetical protein
MSNDGKELVAYFGAVEAFITLIIMIGYAGTGETVSYVLALCAMLIMLSGCLLFGIGLNMIN